MDKVVQRNAASAEESSSASQQMNAQAEQMNGFVGEPVLMVGGSDKSGTEPEKVRPLRRLGLLPSRAAVRSVRASGIEEPDYEDA